MEKKNLAVIGYGGMGRRFHCGHAKTSDVVTLKGVYDVRPEKREIARQDGLPVYETLDKVLSDRDVDIVTVAIPNDMHKEVVIKALESGKNVICEKPVCLNSNELEEMISASKRTGKLFTVHQNRRWDTDMMRIRALYNKGELGKIRSIESRVHGSRGVPGDWRKEKAHGGGMVFDWGVHLIDQALQVIPDSKVKSVYCRLDHITTSEVDDGCHIVIGFENGVDYTVEIGTSNYITLPRFYMRGEKGSAVIVNWDEPMKVTVKKDLETGEATPIKAESGLTKTMAPRDDDTTYSYEVPMPFSDVHDFYRNFCRAIDGKEDQIVKHDEIRRVMKIMEAGFLSAENNQVVKTDI